MRHEFELSEHGQAVLSELMKYHQERLFRSEQERALLRANQDKLRPAKLSRALVAMSEGGLSDGPEREFFAETARASGQPFDPSRIVIPFQLFQHRDLSAASASAGGFLTETNTREAIDLLRPFSVMARMGVMIETNLVGNQYLGF